MNDLFPRCLRLVIGLTLLSLVVGFFASGVSPPGICGAVLRHNQACDIDASPLIYSEVENMAELERGVAELRTAANRRASANETAK
jgi:hypothetical protein